MKKLSIVLSMFAFVFASLTVLATEVTAPTIDYYQSSTSGPNHCDEPFLDEPCADTAGTQCRVNGKWISKRVNAGACLTVARN